MSSGMTVLVAVFSILAFLYTALLNLVHFFLTNSSVLRKTIFYRRILPFSHVSGILMMLCSVFMACTYFHPESLLLGDTIFCREWYIAACVCYVTAMYTLKMAYIVRLNMVNNPTNVHNWNCSTAAYLAVLCIACIGVNFVQFVTIDAAPIIRYSNPDSDDSSNYYNNNNSMDATGSDDSEMIEYEYGCEATFDRWNGFLACGLLATDAFLFRSFVVAYLLKIQQSDRKKRAKRKKTRSRRSRIKTLTSTGSNRNKRKNTANAAGTPNTPNTPNTANVVNVANVASGPNAANVANVANAPNTPSTLKTKDSINVTPHNVDERDVCVTDSLKKDVSNKDMKQQDKDSEQGAQTQEDDTRNASKTWKTSSSSKSGNEAQEFVKREASHERNERNERSARSARSERSDRSDRNERNEVSKEHKWSKLGSVIHRIGSVHRERSMSRSSKKHKNSSIEVPATSPHNEPVGENEHFNDVDNNFNTMPTRGTTLGGTLRTLGTLGTLSTLGTAETAGQTDETENKVNEVGEESDKVNKKDIVRKGLMRHFGLTLLTLMVSLFDLIIQTIVQDYDMLWLVMVDVMIHVTANFAIFSDGRELLFKWCLCCQVVEWCGQKHVQGTIAKNNKTFHTTKEGNGKANECDNRDNRDNRQGDKEKNRQTEIDFGSQIRFESKEHPSVTPLSK